MNRNVLSDIPRELLTALRADLPSPLTCDHCHLITKLPDGTRARVTFNRSKSRKGLFKTRWYWVPVRAEVIDG